ncbi:DUF11 domain-containing protein [Nodosilinea sp. LEGE 06152]|uniref:DUF11 domain-containing protein n=1 Tax=Nodosilinea sp. LEGE 06152 TaxID=2777966 RepID=UPI00187DEE35|nr:DUF11 domain-containing protein [Nodosilinea sp. LEGE 06152]MBE9156031.1 DUF11 domain-containing protein [Nodosilinea sp. LEGE 06152]
MRQFFELIFQSSTPRRRLRRWLSLVLVLVLVTVNLVGWPAPAQAQVATSLDINGLFTTTVPGTPSNYNPAPFADPCTSSAAQGFPGCAGATTNLSFGQGNELVLQAVTAGPGRERFEPATEIIPPAGLPQRIVFRRNGAVPIPPPPAAPTGTLGSREQLFFEAITATTGTISLAPSEPPPGPGGTEFAILSRVINRGIDNVFNNIGFVDQDHRNNIERVDYLIGNPGVTLTAEEADNVGFLILERGGNDAFGIAAVTGLDAGGNPTSYGPLRKAAPGDWGPPGVNVGVRYPSVVLRKDTPATTNPDFRPSHQVEEQDVRGIVFPISFLLPPGQSTQPFFGYSLFANDVNGTPDQLVDFTNQAVFPLGTGSGSLAGGLDLVAGGFGLVRRVTSTVPAGNLALLKRITNLFGPAPLPDFNQVVGDGTALTLLQNNGLGQGLDVIDDPPVQTSNGIEYTVYFANPGAGNANNVVLCDQIPIGTTFNPNSFGTGQGIQAIASSAPAGPVVNYTNANDGDPGQFVAPGAALPPFCGTNQGNGAVVVNAGTIGSNQVGLIRFRTTVD